MLQTREWLRVGPSAVVLFCAVIVAVRGSTSRRVVTTVVRPEAERQTAQPECSTAPCIGHRVQMSLRVERQQERCAHAAAM